MTQTDPDDQWAETKLRHPIGSPIEGVVVKVEPYGVWVGVGNGTEALLLVPEIGGDVRKQIEDYPQVGEWIAAKVLWHNDQQRKLSLSQRN
jgi:small subunit ribosomal protein S1